MSSDPVKHRARQIEHVQSAIKILDKMKVAAGCADCGFKAWPEALHFDHIDPNTKRAELGWQVDRWKLRSKARIDRYIAHVTTYCEIRCANCHAHRTKMEKQWTVRRDSAEVKADGTEALF